MRSITEGAAIMTRSKIDLDALREFRNQLKDARDEIANERKKLIATVGSARTFWKDDDYKIFEGRHSAADLALSKFIRQCDSQIAWIEEKERRGRVARNYQI